MPNTAPMIVTASRSPLQISVAETEWARIPLSTPRPTSHGPTIIGSCQSTPTTAAVVTTSRWLRSTHRRNRAGERRSGSASGVSPGSV